MRKFGWVAFLALMSGVTGCDQATKQLAGRALGAHALPLWPGAVELRLAHNTDSAFSLLGGALAPHTRLVLLSALGALATFAALAVVVRYWDRLSPLARAGGALIVGGGIGNVVERLWHGHVVDFIHVDHWPVFNVADVAITLGALALFFGLEPRVQTRGS